MSKKKSKQMEEILLAERYNEVVETLADAGKPLYVPEVLEKTGFTISQLKAANKYGRRVFGEKKIPITDYVLAGPHGLFLPRRGRDIVAYVAYNFKKINSEMRTLKAIYDYAMEKYGAELLEEINKKDDSDVINDEVIPWEVFDRIMNTTYEGGNKK